MRMSGASLPIGLLAALAVVGCGPISPHASRHKLDIDDHPMVCQSVANPGEYHLCPRISEDGNTWLEGGEIEGFEPKWGFESRIVVVSRNLDPGASHSRIRVTHEKTLYRRKVDPGTEVTIGGEDATYGGGAPPFELTGATSGAFEDGKRFECDDRSVCDDLKTLLENPEIEEPGLSYELTLAYQTDIHGPLLLQHVQTLSD